MEADSMNINSFLCKHFDDDGKGYVNIGDVILKPFKIILEVLEFVYSEEVFPIIVFIGAVFMVVGMVSAFLQGFINEDSGFIDILVAILKGWIIPAIIIVISYLTYKPMRYVMNLKVAKCPLKENKEDD